MHKTTKIAIGTGVGIVLIGGLLYYAQPETTNQNLLTDSQANNQAPLASQLSADKTQHDFGDISMKNGKVSTIFTLTNPNSDSVKIKKLYTSCMCTEAFVLSENKETGPFSMPGHGALKPVNKSLGFNEQLQIKVVYDPNAHGPSGIGRTERDIIAENESGKIFQLKIKANVTP